MKYLIRIALIIVLLGLGFLLGHGNQPEVQLVDNPVYIVDNERLERYQTYIDYLIELNDEYQDDLNDRGKLLIELEDENAELRFKVALYRAMTGQEIEVKVGRAK